MSATGTSPSTNGRARASNVVSRQGPSMPRRRAVPIAAAALALLMAGPGEVRTQQPLPLDGIVRLLLKIEQVMQAGNPDGYMDLLSSVAHRGLAREAAEALVVPGITRAVIRERDRGPLEGTLPGDGYRLMVEIFTERGRQARVVTWRLDVRRVPTDTSGDEWRIAGQQALATVDGLSRLFLDPERQYRVRDFATRAHDLDVRMGEGLVFVASSAGGPTAAVFVPIRDGVIRFRPAPEVEREQLRAYAGSDTIDTRFEALFLRLHPSDFRRRFPPETLAPEPVDPRVFRKAAEVFKESVPKSYGLDLADLSRDVWSIEPQPGDFLAEIQTRRFQTLTYARSASDPEDISLFDRRRRRNISLYASPERLAAGGRSFDEDGQAPYEVSHYQLDVSIDPERFWLDGRALVSLRVTANAINRLTLRLAEPLTVRSVHSVEFGRLLALRVRGQNNVVVNLTGFATRGTILNLVVAYSGRLEPDEPDRETAAPQFPQDTPILNEASSFPAETNLLYSTRSYWYPQASSGGYATATLHLAVPEPYHVVASGELAPGSPVVVPQADRHQQGRLFTFEARQPVRYLACLISRFTRVDSRTVSLVDAIGSVASRGSTALPSIPAGSGAFNGEIALTVQANPRQAGRGRNAAAVLAGVMEYYASLVGDAPYPALTLALIEKNLPGGHSPPYLAILNQPLPAAAISWSGDPAAFQGFPEFFLAHEAAHQWWGQAVGWRNYHDQWISEGFSQYFAALWGRKSQGDGLFGQLLRRMAQWARKEGHAGPVSLGYRLGHIKDDSRIFRAIVYNKSATVLHMLRRMIGDDAFFRGVRHLYFEFRFRKAGTDDVRRAFEQESGRSLKRFFDEWIDGFGTPLVAMTWSTRIAPAPAVTLRVEQRGRLHEFPVTATIHYGDGRTEDHQIVAGDRVSEFSLPVSGDVRKVTLNRDGLTPLEIAPR